MWKTWHDFHTNTYSYGLCSRYKHGVTGCKRAVNEARARGVQTLTFSHFWRIRQTKMWTQSAWICAKIIPPVHVFLVYLFIFSQRCHQEAPFSIWISKFPGPPTGWGGGGLPVKPIQHVMLMALPECYSQNNLAHSWKPRFQDDFSDEGTRPFNHRCLACLSLGLLPSIGL